MNAASKMTGPARLPNLVQSLFAGYMNTLRRYLPMPRPKLEKARWGLVLLEGLR